MAKKRLSKEDEKQLLLLKSSYQMHLKTKEETELRGKEESIERMDIILRDTLQQMAKIDPDFAQQCYENGEAQRKRRSSPSIMIGNDDTDSVFAAIKDLEEPSEDSNVKIPTEEFKEAEMDSFYDNMDDNADIYALADTIDDTSTSEIERKIEEEQENEVKPISSQADPTAQFDYIPLPSKGQCYKNKKDRLSVSYLTASDENLITSPNLYQSGQISNVLLKRKILDKDIDIENLVAGDVDAIMVFLRGTSYGNDFPITAKDPKTGKTIDTTVDLSTLGYKPFKLKGDEDGLFSFDLPRMKKTVKFKFLTKREMDILKKLNKKENDGIASFELQDAVEKVKNVLKSDTNLSDADKNAIISANSKLEAWSKSLNDRVKAATYTKTITNTMEMQIVEVDGVRDKSYIHEFVMNMPASDSLAFRRYVYDNSPGVDFEVEVKRPESMGGGSFKCFLEWDDYVFWLIS